MPMMAFREVLLMKKSNLLISLLFILLALGSPLIYMNGVHEAKEALAFNQNDILKVSIDNTKKTISEDYKIPPANIQEINTQLTDNKKVVVKEATLDIPYDKAAINIFLDKQIEVKNENGAPYKAFKREISIIPKDDENVYVAITVRNEKNSKKNITGFFSVKSPWLSQYLIDVRNEFAK